MFIVRVCEVDCVTFWYCLLTRTHKPYRYLGGISPLVKVLHALQPFHCFCLRLRANGCNIVDQQLPTLLDVTCCICLHTLLHVVGCCCAKFETAQLFSQRLPTFLLFRDHRSVVQQCWMRLHSSSNIVGAMHAHYAWFTKTHGLYPSHDALQVLTLLGVVASVCTPLPTHTQQLPTLLHQQCWEFARSLRLESTFNTQSAFSVYYGPVVFSLCVVCILQ